MRTPGRLSVLGFAATAAFGAWLSVTFSTGDKILGGRWAILARLALWVVVWVVGVVFALRLPPRIAATAIFLAAIALRLGALAGPPVLSDDLYRYSWDGRVQSAGIDPYRYPPEAAELRRLREPWLWPDDAGCGRIDRPPGCTRINRPAERTIYPPLAQGWFRVVYGIAGIAARDKAWQVAGLVTDVALVGILMAALAAWGRDRRWAALYALAPFPVIEVVNNGHVDGLAALLVIGALVFAGRRRPAWAGAFMGAATLVKLYPALLIVALVAVVARRSVRTGRLQPLVTSGVAASAVVAAGYLPHVLAVGARVLGYLPGYLREEHYDEGGRYLLAGIFGLAPTVTAALAGVGVAAVVVWVLARRPPPAEAATALMGALLLATTPVQPWYAVVLLAAATLALRPMWALVAAAGYPFFFAVILDLPQAVAVGRVSYGIALVAVIAAAVMRRRALPLRGDGGDQVVTQRAQR